MSELLGVSCRIYGRLLLLYPVRLRADFGEEMAGVFEQQLRDALESDGLAGLIRVWWCAIEELARIAAPSHVSLSMIQVPVLSVLWSAGLFWLLFSAVAPP